MGLMFVPLLLLALAPFAAFLPCCFAANDDSQIKIYCQPPQDDGSRRHVKMAVWGTVYEFTPLGLESRPEQHNLSYRSSNWHLSGFKSALKGDLVEQEFDELDDAFNMHNYEEADNNCLDFVFKFVDAITGHKAADRDKWPPCFVEIDKERTTAIDGGISCFSQWSTGVPRIFVEIANASGFGGASCF